MATKRVFLCDYCQKQKGEANRWWCLRETDVSVGVHRFSEAMAVNPDTKLACSSACLNKGIDEWCHHYAHGV
jgi:hypothetical protein